MQVNLTPRLNFTSVAYAASLMQARELCSTNRYRGIH
jgi:hypothetical protein